MDKTTKDKFKAYAAKGRKFLAAYPKLLKVVHADLAKTPNRPKE